MQFSQSFLDEIIKLLCSLESPFQVVLKNSPNFYYRTHMTKVMADKSLSTIFFETPCIFNLYIKYFLKFQSPYFWPSQHHTPDHIEYAIYLYKRAQKNKKIHGLEPGLPVSQELFKEFELSLSFRYHIKFPQKSYFQDYENDALVHLKRILANKWDFVVMQAEEQVSSGVQNCCHVFCNISLL